MIGSPGRKGENFTSSISLRHINAMALGRAIQSEMVGFEGNADVDDGRYITAKFLRAATNGRGDTAAQKLGTVRSNAVKHLIRHHLLGDLFPSHSDGTSDGFGARE